MDAAVAIIDARSRILAAAAACGKGDDKVVPIPDLPLLVIIIDEAAVLFGIEPATLTGSGWPRKPPNGPDGSPRSAGRGELLVTTQRPTVAALGDDGDFCSQLHPNLYLRMSRRAEVGWSCKASTATRSTRPCSTFPACSSSKTARTSSATHPLLRPAPIADGQLADPGARPRPADPRPGSGVGPPESRTQLAAPTPFQIPVKRSTTTRTGGTNGATTDRRHTSRASVDALDAARTAADADLPDVPEIPVGDLIPDADAPTEIDVNDAPVADAVAAVLANVGPNGMTAKEITVAVGKHRGSVHRALRTLVDNGDARRVPAGTGYRATTPESNAA